jgi:hypothetical protein
MIMANNISNYFNNVTYDDNTGILTFSNHNNTNIKKYRLLDQSDMNDLIGPKPEIYNIKSNHAIEGSFLISVDNKIVKTLYNQEWKTLYKKNEHMLLRVPYWDNTISYDEKKLVSYEDRKYKSVTNGTTTNKTPDTIDYDYSFNNAQDVEGTELSNINNLHLDNDVLTIVTTDATYYYEKGIVLIYNHSSLGSSRKAVTILGKEAYIFNDYILRVYDSNLAYIDYRFDNKIISITADNEFLYILFDNNKMYKFNISNGIMEEYIVGIQHNVEDIALNSFFIYMINYSQGKLYRIDRNSNVEVEYTIGSNVKSIAPTNDGYFYVIFNNEEIVKKAKIQSGEWEAVDTNYFFKRFNCPQPFIHKITYENVIDKNMYHYVDKYSNAAYFCFVSNKYVMTLEPDSRGRVHKTHIEDGVFNPKYIHEYVDIGGYCNGIAYFQGDLIVANWQELVIIDPDTLQILRRVDLQNKIEDNKILGLTSRGDTLYVMTTNAKLYKFADVDAPVSGTIVLEIFDEAKSRICAINSEVLYITKDKDIWELDLSTGETIDKTPLGRNTDVDIDLLKFELFTLEIGGMGSLSKYRTVFILGEA